MSLKVGGLDVVGVFVGDAAAKVYVGAMKIWPPVPDFTPFTISSEDPGYTDIYDEPVPEGASGCWVTLFGGGGGGGEQATKAPPGPPDAAGPVDEAAQRSPAYGFRDHRWAARTASSGAWAAQAGRLHRAHLAQGSRVAQAPLLYSPPGASC
ncbi:hypothetical protein WHEELER_35 [Mycobacterium phage Wheeler]|uniref:minor tail protein n=1 Tax=Mycobacterium phage Wheeler TaxID=1383054 RepID=UPI0003881F14|nr:minor tail protein [Mycobacterium phage Wheeler]AGT13915.1 hypothetical protein WHEELER_35 [Mycobacterium phage Wheeler]